MAQLFEITATGTTFTFNGEREADTTFSVTNRSGRPVRARTRLVPQEQAQAPWYTPPPDAERPFGVDSTETFDVHIALPRDVPPGSYGFRFDVVDVGNPDENFELGPDVLVHIPEPPPPPEKRPAAFPWKIAVAIGAGTLVLLAILAWVLMRGGDETRFVTVPDVSGMLAENARRTLEGNLEGTCATPPCLNAVTTLEYEAQNPFTGRVTAQDPAPGTELEAKANVQIFVSGVESSIQLEEMLDENLIDQVFVEIGTFKELPTETKILLCDFDSALQGC